MIFEPNGIEIISNDENELINRSPRLRDMLMPLFKKMRRVYPKNPISFFNFLSTNEKLDFTYINNKELSLEIIN